jgi:hypothetical protein
MLRAGCFLLPGGCSMLHMPYVAGGLPSLAGDCSMLHTDCPVLQAGCLLLVGDCSMLHMPYVAGGLLLVAGRLLDAAHALCCRQAAGCLWAT